LMLARECAKVTVSKTELHRLMEAPPKQKNAGAENLVGAQPTGGVVDEAWAEILANPAIYDKPLDNEDPAAIEEAEKDIIAGRVISLDHFANDLGL